MTNILEGIIRTSHSLEDDDPKMPLHVGEVMNCSTLLAMWRESQAYRAGVNTTTDAELRHMLEQVFKDSLNDSQQLENFLLTEGVPLPPMDEPNPDSDPAAIPLGVKATDNKLANGISLKLTDSVALIGQTLPITVRNDVGLMLLQFQANILAYGVNLKSFMRKRGWLKVPPYYYPRGLPK